ncbi:Uncharacterised protein [Alloiococcus otitis]|uniref:Uncharacterized protein n=1 Tax=Alloiococcus otitis ATCC 51267 TaxID=883081 RepID=K9E844_9LACT|nr:hypothetical protein [Alloiococcus otitis]EKU93354.1 hypothetical protein HMPREF9698_01102 [Alloiococcus otitis ATCC 51267]SUU81571.1 Uncharacterised protein [Alloiococcus otitis]
MSNLQYANPNHSQEAQLYIDGRQIARFSASVNGTNLPTYNAWLTPDVTEEDYQKYHEEIHEAYVEFVQRQGENESKLIDRIQAGKSKDAKSNNKVNTNYKTYSQPRGEIFHGVEFGKDDTPSKEPDRQDKTEEDD